jgi:hypothetical protein
MPDDEPLPSAARPETFPPRTLRTAPEERRPVEELTARVIAAHPAWPWPLIEREARRRAEAILAAAARRR